MKNLLVLMICLSFMIQCSSLYKSGVISPDWYLAFGSDESLKLQAREEIKKKEESEKPPEQRFSEKMNSLLGKQKRDIILEMGAPTEIREIDGIEILSYLTNREVSTQGFGFTNYSGLGTSSSTSTLHYEKLDLFFEKNKMIKWDFLKR